MYWFLLFFGLIAIIFGHFSTKSELKNGLIDKEQSVLGGVIYVDGIAIISFGFLGVYYSSKELLKSHFGDTWWLHVISIIFMIGFAWFIINEPKIYKSNANDWTDKFRYIVLFVPFIFIIKDLFALIQ